MFWYVDELRRERPTGCVYFFYEMREKYEKERIKQFLLLCWVKHIAELFSFEQI